MNIHAIQTGTVALTTAWREGVGRGRRRLLHAIVDRAWTEPLPIYAFAIEHPEGVIVVDTGEDARAAEPGYFAGWQPGLRAFRESVAPEEKIGLQLQRLGIQPGDVRWVGPYPSELKLIFKGCVRGRASSGWTPDAPSHPPRPGPVAPLVAASARC